MMPRHHLLLYSFVLAVAVIASGCRAMDIEPATTLRTMPVPPPAEQPVELTVALQSGVLSLSGGSSALFDAEFQHAAGYPPEVVYKHPGDAARLVVRQRRSPLAGRQRDPSEWALNLSPEPPLHLNARLGTGLFTLALGGLNIPQADIRVRGGSATSVNLLGYWPQDAVIDITAGPGTLTVMLPRGTGVRVNVFGEDVELDAGPLATLEPGVLTNAAYGNAPHTLSVRIIALGGEVGFTEGLPADRTVAEALAAARTLYSAEAWGCESRGAADSGEPHPAPQTVGDLWDDYICERGPDHITLDGSSPLTAELARSELLDRIRREYYAGGEAPVEDMLAFNIPEFVSATGDVLMTLQERDEMTVSLTHFIGSFEYSVQPEGDRLRYTVTNQTDRASGTHIPLRFPDAGYTATIESLAAGDPALAEAYIGEVIASERYPVVAVLDAKTRAETEEASGEGGGAFVQTFTWTERRLEPGTDGTLPTWPDYTTGLDVR